MGARKTRYLTEGPFLVDCTRADVLAGDASAVARDAFGLNKARCTSRGLGLSSLA